MCCHCHVMYFVCEYEHECELCYRLQAGPCIATVSFTCVVEFVDCQLLLLFNFLFAASLLYILLPTGLLSITSITSCSCSKYLYSSSVIIIIIVITSSLTIIMFSLCYLMIKNLNTLLREHSTWNKTAFRGRNK